MTTIPSLELIWDLYVLTRGQLWELRSEVLDYLEGRSEETDKMSGSMHLSSAEVRDMFENYLDELDRMIMLDLFTALEGRVRADFDDRVRRRKKDALSQHYCALEKSGKFLNGRVPLETLAEAWKQHLSICKNHIGNIRGAWYYRNWLAHGRWWVFKQNPTPDVENLRVDIKKLLECLNIPFA